MIQYSSLDLRVSIHWIRITRTNLTAKIPLHSSRGRDLEKQGKYLVRTYCTRYILKADPEECPKREM